MSRVNSMCGRQANMFNTPFEINRRYDLKGALARLKTACPCVQCELAGASAEVSVERFANTSQSFGCRTNYMFQEWHLIAAWSKFCVSRLRVTGST